MKKMHPALFSAVFLFASLTAMPVIAEPPQAGAHRQPAPEGAVVRFDGLEDGAVVPPTFTVRFAVDGMEVAPAGSDIPNTGHHHVLVDVEELPDPNLPLPMNDHVIHFGGGQTETELTLPEGNHTLQLLFADYAHIPHDPVVASERITITVSADAEE